MSVKLPIANKVISHIKSIIKILLKVHPDGIKFIRIIIFWLWRMRAITIKQTKGYEVSKIFWIDPKEIKYSCVGIDYRKPGYNKFLDRGKIINGNWDLNRIKFENLIEYKSFIDHFEKNKKWKDTEFYKKINKEISNGETPWGCKNLFDFESRLKDIDKLYNVIKSDGYKTKEDLMKNAKDKVHILENIDEIAIRIGRNGEYLFEDGRHRLIIAKMLNVPKVPVNITVRHYQWYSFRKEVLKYEAENNNRIYHPIMHMDLEDIAYAHSENRYEIIKPYLPGKKGDLLDIGANWGYFCHKFEDMGFNCFAVEEDMINTYFLEKLRNAKNKNFKIIQKSIFEYDISKKSFSVVLALNIFHHFLKNEHVYFKFVEFLEKINTKIMIFEPHLPNDPQMQTAYKNFSCDDFVKFIKNNTTLKKSSYIGNAEDNRPIYYLSR